MNWVILIRESFSTRQIEVAFDFVFHYLPQIKIEASLRITCVISFMNKHLLEEIEHEYYECF